MDNLRLRAIIIKLQDRLSDDDRRRLHFFFGNDVPRRIRDDPTLGGTLCLMESLFDQDKINEQDFTFLIEAFEQIKCSDAAKLLREYKQQGRSIDTNASIQSLAVVLPEKSALQSAEEEEDKFASSKMFDDVKEKSVNYCTNVKELNFYQNSRKENDSTIETSLSTFSKMKTHLVWCLFVFFLFGVGFGAFWIQSGRLKSKAESKEMNYNEEMKKQNETIRQLNEILVQKNSTIYKLHEEIAASALSKNPQEHWQKGTICTCDAWCRGSGKKHGVCGDGHTCICRDHPITKATPAEGCSCDSWCQLRGHENGGVCGDGYTCICS